MWSFGWCGMGRTAWSLSGAHTSRTDIPLTDHGRLRAAELKDYFAGKPFAAVFTSPMRRARETCAIAGYAEVAVIDEGLKEWDYGVYEGKTTAEIRQGDPDWSVWKDEITSGESVEQVGERADGVIMRAVAGGWRRERRGGGFICPCTYSADTGVEVDRLARRWRAATGAWDGVSECAGA